MRPSTTYVLSGWGKVSAYDTQLVVGVKNYGGSDIRVPAFVNKTWAGGSLTFTTGAANTQATVYCFTRLGAGAGRCDDVKLVAAP